ncbi:MAG TPA: hypothetical protein IAD33_10730 [Candidatus Scatomorpha gallistercoris]|nr:hypothetical protein [Candidatus Scatomorpha gallistercoris]
MFNIAEAHERIYAHCLAYAGSDALECALELMRTDALRFHGPEHHYLTAASLCAAWCNAIGANKAAHLENLKARCARIPPAVCGYYGVCGDSMAAGACASEMMGASYLSDESWQRVNELTSRTQAAIAASCTRGPRCCKRTTFAVIIAASEWIHDTLGVDVAVHEGFKCGFFAENKQCLGKDCLFSNSHDASMEV